MYFEDFQVGDVFTTAAVTLTEAAIIDFAQRYDPQPFHIDNSAASESVYGGLIASGWHVLSLTFAEIVRTGIFDGGGQGSPGIDALRWLKPVRPGDTLHVELTVTDLRTSATRSDRGYVTLTFEILNQHDETVTSYTAVEIMRRRHPGKAEPGAPG